MFETASSLRQDRSPSPLTKSIFQKLEVHGLCELSVHESRRTLLSHPGAPSLGLISVLGWVSFVRSLHFGFGPSPRPRQEPPTFFASAMSCFVPWWHEPDCGHAEHCFSRTSVFSGHCQTFTSGSAVFLHCLIFLTQSRWISFHALDTFPLQSVALVMSLRKCMASSLPIQRKCWRLQTAVRTVPQT